MATNAQEKIDKLPPERREAVRRRTNELIAEVMKAPATVPIDSAAILERAAIEIAPEVVVTGAQVECRGPDGRRFVEGGFVVRWYVCGELEYIHFDQATWTGRWECDADPSRREALKATLCRMVDEATFRGSKT